MGRVRNGGVKLDTKERIIELLMSTERPGIGNLILSMDEIQFFDAPCSTQYHLACFGGLARHSLNVYEFGVNHTGGLMNNSISHWIIVSLLHDIGKAKYRGKENYIPNMLKGNVQSTVKPFETNTDRLYIPHEIVSLQIVAKHIELTEEEEFAILYHNGLYVPSGRDVQGKERPLQLLLHFADMWCSRFIEKGC